MEEKRLNHATLKQLKDVHGVIISRCRACDLVTFREAAELTHPHAYPVWQLRLPCRCGSYHVRSEFFVPWTKCRTTFATDAIRIARSGTVAERVAALDYVEDISVATTVIRILRSALLSGDDEMIAMGCSFLA